jgi:hypothetical protein
MKACAHDDGRPGTEDGRPTTAARCYSIAPPVQWFYYIRVRLR